MQKYHDEPKQYKGYLKSALAHAAACNETVVLVVESRVTGPARLAAAA